VNFNTRTPGILVVDLDLKELDAVRTRMPIAMHRRQGMENLGWS